MDTKFEVNPVKATITLVLTVVLFFASVILALVVFQSKTIYVKAAFILAALVFVGLSFIAYRIYSGAYFIAVKGKDLVLSRALSKTMIPLDAIEKLDLVKGKNVFQGDDVLVLEYKKDKVLQPEKFLLFYLKDTGDKIYSTLVKHLEG